MDGRKNRDFQPAISSAICKNIGIRPANQSAQYDTRKSECFPRGSQPYPNGLSKQFEPKPRVDRAAEVERRTLKAE
jgi:hypothetical protein